MGRQRMRRGTFKFESSAVLNRYQTFGRRVLWSGMRSGLLALVLGLVFGPWSRQLVAQEKGLAAANPPACQPGNEKFVGNGLCIQCHSGSVQPLLPSRNLPTDFVLLNEGSIFAPEARPFVNTAVSNIDDIDIELEQHHGDIHRLAYVRLYPDQKDSLGNRIWNQVRKSLAGFEDKPLKEAAHCLACHSGWLGKPGQDQFVYALEHPNVERGVSCEGCHGGGSKWVSTHNQPIWRTRSPKEKADCGMVDVRNPVQRAMMCYSCHIGDKSQGRVVTHAMYAAGHPPLPGIEIESYSSRMPRHWRSLREKGEFGYRREYVDKNLDKNLIVDAELPQTKAVLVGGLMALRQSLSLMAAMSEPTKGTDFAVFDCQACHHNLKYKSWRQARYDLEGYKRRPGQIYALEWPAALAMIAMPYADARDSNGNLLKREDLASKLQELDSAFESASLGEPATIQRLVSAEGSGLSDWLKTVAESLSKTPLDAQTAGKVLSDLDAFKPGSTFTDFHARQQIAWAHRIVRLEIAAGYPQFPARPNAGMEVDRDRILGDLADFKSLTIWRQKRHADEVQILNEADEIALTREFQLNYPNAIVPLLEDWKNENPALWGKIDPATQQTLSIEGKGVLKQDERDRIAYNWSTFFLKMRSDSYLKSVDDYDPRTKSE